MPRYQGPGQKVWEPVPTPTIAQPTDAIVKIAKTTICGTDLHILKGDVPAVTSGRILGHEAVGIVDEVGAAVRNCKKGDRVLISCITSCGKCEYCKRQMYAHCEDGGWILGHRINGTQAEYVRIPHADNSLYLVPAGADEEALVMLSDILPTGFAVEAVMAETKDGVDVAIEAVGVPQTFDVCQSMSHRQCRRPRKERGLPDSEALDPEHHAHDPPGEHEHHADAAQDGRVRETAPGAADQSPLHVRPVRPGLRRLQQCGEGEGAEGAHRQYLERFGFVAATRSPGLQVEDELELRP